MMREYSVEDYGLVMEKDMLETVCSKYCNDYTKEKYADDEFYFNDQLYEAGIVEYISSFTGESMVIDDDGTDIYNSGNTYDDDIIYYIPIKNYPNFFKAAYENIDEIVSEFRWKLCDYLPDSFNYKEHICHIVGTYFG